MKVLEIVHASLNECISRARCRWTGVLLINKTAWAPIDNSNYNYSSNTTFICWQHSSVSEQRALNNLNQKEFVSTNPTLPTEDFLKFSCWTSFILKLSISASFTWLSIKGWSRLSSSTPTGQRQALLRVIASSPTILLDTLRAACSVQRAPFQTKYFDEFQIRTS